MISDILVRADPHYRIRVVPDDPENDDKPSLYSTQELYDGVYKRIGIPIVFDYTMKKPFTVVCRYTNSSIKRFIAFDKMLPSENSNYTD